MQFVTFCENVHIMLRYTIRYRVVCRCACVSVEHNHEPTEMPFGLWTVVDPENNGMY